MAKELNIIQTDGQTATCTEKDFPNFARNGWKIVEKAKPEPTKAKKVKEDKVGK